MSWLDSFDPQTYALNYAQYDVAAMQNMLKAQQGKVSSEQGALTTLKTALTDFRAALNSLGAGGSTGGIVKNTATASENGYVSMTAHSNAKKGIYQVSVEKTASAQQDAYEKLTDDAVKNATGTMTIQVGEKDVSIELDDLNSLSELADKINELGEEEGLTASLVKRNGSVTMMLSSESGKDNHFEIMNSAGMNMEATSISAASDAVIKMGELEFSSATNAFNDVIPGVDLTVMRETEQGKPLIISVENNAAETQTQAQAFIDAYNKLRSEIDSLTSSGTVGSDGSASGRGALAGDSGIRALEAQLNEMIRKEFGGDKVRLADFGITSDKEGKLQLDSKAFGAAMKENPEGLNTLFEGTNGLLKGLDKGLDSMLSTSRGTIKQRQESLDRKNALLTAKENQINTRYEKAYERYLKQFTNMQSIVNQMQNTSSMFF
ncbi:flagellar filament capping protein FliD [Enterobacteriaceae bacterium LUAb1]